jgi:hypothetical protein
MPKAELHKKKRAKNIAVFLAVLAFMAVIYLVTVIRIQAGLNAGP